MPEEGKEHGWTLRGWSVDPVIGVLAVAACLVIIAVGLTWSDSDEDRPTANGAPVQSRGSATTAPPPSIVTDAEIAATPKASPERTLFRFFQAVQFQDIAAIRQLVTPAARRAIGRPRLEAVLAVVGPAAGKPQVFDIRRDGDRATVRLLILGFATGRDKPVTSQPATFSLTRLGGKWQLTTLRYLVTTANDIARERRRRAR